MRNERPACLWWIFPSVASGILRRFLGNEPAKSTGALGEEEKERWQRVTAADAWTASKRF
jgi:hypothetical protein